MTCRATIVATAVLALAAAPVAAAIGISQASFTINANGSMPLCLQRARSVLEQAGLQVLNTSASSIGAEPQDGRVLVTAYCLPSVYLVVLTAAGQHTDDTLPIMERLRMVMQQPMPPLRPVK